MSPAFTPRTRSISLLACTGIVMVGAGVLVFRERTAVASSAKLPARASPIAGAASNPTAAPLDPTGAALTAALGLPEGAARARAFGRLFAEWTARDPQAALAYLRQMPRGREFSTGLLIVLDAMSRRDLPQSLTLARELVTTAEEAQFYSVVFDRLARASVARALEQLALVPPGDGRLNALRALLGVWAQSQFDAALAWAQQQPDPLERSAAVESTLDHLTARDPLAAIEVAQRALTGDAFERTVSHALRRLAVTDPQAAAALVPLLRPGDEHTMTASVVAQALARQDIQSALAWVDTIPIDLTRWLVLNNVLTVWVQTDRDAAARYVLALPPGYALDLAARQLAPYLAAEPRDALAWAAALPTDSARTAAYPMIASTWAQRAPADAVRWAAGLREDPLNAEALPAAFAYWQLQDPRAARAWLQTAALPPAMKSRLLEP